MHTNTHRLARLWSGPRNWDAGLGNSQGNGAHMETAAVEMVWPV